MSSTEPTTAPPCGMATCDRRATRADRAGVGFCTKHGREFGLPLVSDDNPFDPWWEAAARNPAAFKGLDYGQYPSAEP